MTPKNKKNIVIAIGVGVTAVLAIAAYVVVKCSDKESRKNNNFSDSDSDGLSNSDGLLEDVLKECGQCIKASFRKENKAAIKGALSEKDAKVTYYPPTSDGQCGHYRVEAKDGANLEDMNSRLETVAENLGLEIDDESYNIWDLVDRGDTKK